MFKFDDLGFLMPYERQKATIEDVFKNLVQDFSGSETRAKLFENLLKYNEDLQEVLRSDYFQYINGSFTTKKNNPNDIDLVNFVDHQALLGNEKQVEENFLNKSAIDIYGIDAYLVVVYPEFHPYRVRTLSDVAYWNHWFGFSKFDRRKKRSPKGFLEVSFYQAK
jgi:hypothetical protein